MDGIKLRRHNARVARPAGQRPALLRTQSKTARPLPLKITRNLGRFAIRKTRKVKKRLHTRFVWWLQSLPRLYRISAVFLIVIMVSAIAVEVLRPFAKTQSYELSKSAREVLPRQNDSFAKLVEFDAKEQVYKYNAGYTGIPSKDDDLSGNGNPRFNAVLHADPAKGVTVTDPVSKVTFGLKPKFGLQPGRQDKNQIIYPLDGGGHLVYTGQVASLKEDIVLSTPGKDKRVFEYEMILDDGTEARVESNGSVGVYGSDLPLYGNVATGSDADKELLEKAKVNAQKNKLLFTIPAPVVVEYNKSTSSVKSRFEVDGNRLRVISEGLKKASYPLSIDPSIYIETAQEFMRGNNDTNIDFDVSNELIQKGQLTGARIPGWTSSMSLPAARWAQGTVVAGGYVYVIGGSNGTVEQKNVYWAKFDPNNYTLTSPNPGNGACATWCTDVGYDLPFTRSNAATITYNGYLYVIGGTGNDVSCSGSAKICNTVYYSKIGANGEPTAWLRDADLPNGADRKNTSVQVYNNYAYLVGGQTNASPNGSTRIDFAPVNPNGTFGTWTQSATGTPGTQGWYGMSLLQFGGYLYFIGGNNSGALTNTTYYIKLNANGTLANTWVQSTSFNTPRQSFGGNFAQIWGGYIYVSSGCNAQTGQSCTAFANDLQLASLNADGSISDWTLINNVNLPQNNSGNGFVTWRNTLYVIAGCSQMTSGNCTTTLTNAYYGKINNDGDVSPFETVSAQPAQGTGAANVGRAATGTVINNGYIYNIGGCANVACTTMNSNTAYATIASDGTVGAWVIDSTGTLNGATGLGAFGVSTYNNTVYAVGGSSGAAYQDSIFRATFNSDGSIGAWTEQDAQQQSNYGHSYVMTRADSPTAGSLYIIGGCDNGGASGISCTNGNHKTTVSRCTITNATGAISGCSTTNQLQLGTGVGLMTGITYAGYIYLAGGADNNNNQTDTVYFATIDNSGNIVRKDSGLATGGWDTTTALTRTRNRAVGFGVNGYVYIAAGYDGSGTPATLSDITFAKIDQSNGELGAFRTSEVSVTARWNAGAAVGNSYAFIVGGCTAGAPAGSCTTMSGANEKIQIYNNYSASPASYVSSANDFTTDRLGASAAILNGYLYVAGGCTAGDCTASTNTVQYVLLNADGSIPATWANTTASLGGNRAWGQLETVGGTLYYIGGQTTGNTTGQSTIYYGTPSAGNVTAWTAASAALPAARTQFSSTVWNNRIYVTGGLDNSPAAQNTIYASPSLPSGGNITGSWTSTGMTSFTTARSGHVSTAYGGRLYVLGGHDDTNYLLDVQFADINSDGTIGSWSATSTLPRPVRQSDGIAANGFMYVFGGRSDATTCSNDTYISPVNANGTLGSWSQSSIRYTIARYGATAAYNEGKAYVLGGACGATPTYSGVERTYYATLLFQPQIARYSISIDTDTDVFPTKFLANGLDNSDGARWLLNYRSATNTTTLCTTPAMTAWGQNTNFGAITLGTPGNYIPVNGSGVGTNCARFYYLALTIDSQNAFAFPEDVSRGPTITDLTLFFTADPSKRLRHGKTFTDGIEQPLDTPF